MTTDRSRAEQPFWSHHVVEFILTPTLKIKGTSKTEGGELEYRIEGNFDGDELRLLMLNEQLSGDNAFVWIFNLLHSQLLNGFLLGNDFDRKPFVSPMFYSRSPLASDVLSEFLRNSKVKNVSSTRLIKPVKQ